MFPLFGQGGSVYPFTPQDASGGPSWPYFAAIDEAVTQKQPNFPYKLGQVITDRYGNWYSYIHAAAALAQGVAVKKRANPSAGTVQATDSTADNKTIVKINFSSITAGREVGNWLFFRTTLKLKKIKDNTATAGGNTYFTISKKSLALGRPGSQSQFYDGDYESTALTGETVDLIRPFNVDVAGAGDVCFGVAQQAITSGQRGLVMISGLGYVLGIGSTDAIADNGLICTAASGKVKGPTTAALTAGDVLGRVGIAKSAYTGASALVPASIDVGFSRV